VALRRLMVPLDGSALAEAALPVAAYLAQAAGAKLLLVRAEPWLASHMGEFEYAGYVTDIERLEAEVAARAMSYLALVQEQLPPGLGVETAVHRGYIVDALLDCAERGDIDLIAMSTHGRGGLRRLVLGSTADRFVRAGLPTLLVPPADHDAARTGLAAEAAGRHADTGSPLPATHRCAHGGAT
jgi:nucleotide-binding universal stress UspA family protein